MADTEEQHQQAEQNEDNQSKTGANNADKDEDETLTIVSELEEESPKMKKKQNNAEERDSKRKQFFKEELKRLQKSLEKESSKIQAPPLKEYIPYCFNTLEPYYNTATAIHVIEKTGDNGKLKGAPSDYATRQTAIGLVDPWINHEMDVVLAPKVKVKEPVPFRETPKKEKKQGEGSTIIPNYPMIDMEAPDLPKRKLDYGDVPLLRKELREKYSSQGKAKINQDYKRTKVDFYRMELHKLKDVHPMNRPNMKAAYYAYLQNTPGSKKALVECVKDITIEEKKKDDPSTNENQQEQSTEENESGKANFTEENESGKESSDSNEEKPEEQ